MKEKSLVIEPDPGEPNNDVRVVFTMGPGKEFSFLTGGATGIIFSRREARRLYMFLDRYLNGERR